MILKYNVIKEDENRLLKDILKNKLYISNSLMNKMKNGKCIFVNNEHTFVTYKIKENDEIQIYLDNIDTTTSFIDKFEILDLPLDILYEDEYLLIVNKPVNMPTHPSNLHYNNTLANVVASYLKKQGINNIHIITRLDKNTTGACIFAKNEYIQELFMRKKEDINFIKEYLCLANGIFKDNYGIIEEKIARKDNSIILRQVNKNGEYAKTEYYVLSKNVEKNYSILKVLLHTGKTHQIRVHMAYLGHVLLGDSLYAKEYNIDNICTYINRQALHCYKISFNHPITNKQIIICANIPEDISALCNLSNGKYCI